MGETPEELREQLATKREDLSRDLEAIGDRVSPGRVMERKQASVRMRVGDVRDRVMGAKDSMSSHLHDAPGGAASAAGDMAGRVGDTARARTEGSPLAAGMVAFGVGAVAAALFPATRREQQMAQQVQPTLERAASEAAPMAKQVMDEVRPAAEGAVAELKDEAKHAAANVKDQAASATAETKGAAKSAASTQGA
jgi:hypothetical protein